MTVGAMTGEESRLAMLRFVAQGTEGTFCRIAMVLMSDWQGSWCPTSIGLDVRLALVLMSDSIGL